jgi:membrane-bound lytic murein transglycosylase D
MENHQPGAPSRQQRNFGGALIIGFFYTLALITIFDSAVLAQGRGTVANNPDGPSEFNNRAEEIQRVIERSHGYFQSGELNFKEGNYEKARREYDHAVDVVLNSGIDVRSDTRLQQHYQNLIDLIFQRQMTLATYVPEKGSLNQVTAQQVESQGQNRNQDRGFGQQVYTPSPLDDLAKLKLTDEEMKGATEANAQTTLASANLDFRIKKLHPLVEGYINYYRGRGRDTMEQGLRRSGRFMAMARKIFKEEGVPQDIAWLGQVESAWSPIARSWAAAVGLWQFIPETGARYGLRQNQYVDERSSFEKATRASARYLKWLANRYDGNWELAMAAYNSGEGRVDSAIARSGYADFWEIYSRGLLPTETRNYVPNILATIVIAKNAERYGFSVKPEPALTYDYVKVNNMVDLKLVSDATDTPYDVLEALNPELKRGVTPPGIEHLLRVPSGKGRVLLTALMRIPAEKRASWRMVTAQNDDTFETISRRTGVSASAISQLNGGALRPGQKVIVPANGSVRNAVYSSVKGSMTSSGKTLARGARFITYKVKSNETLGDIAARYNTSVRNITALNGLRSTAKLRAGQVIKVPVRQDR